jgi:hypothetical protein
MQKDLETITINDPNPLTHQQTEVFRSIMAQKHNFYPSLEDVLEIKQYFSDCQIKEVRTIKGDKGHTYVDFKGGISRFSNYDSRLIEILATLDAELKIRMMAIQEADMEAYILAARKQLSKEFSNFFKEKRYENKETGEYPDWDSLFSEYYNDYDFKKPYTTKKIMLEINSGKMTLANAAKLLSFIKDEVFLRE